VSVQLEALADEVFEAATALDLVVPSNMRTVAAPGEAVVAMVQVFTDNLSISGFSILPVQGEERWTAFEGLIRADSAEQGRTDEMTAKLIALDRWRAANTPHRFYLAYHGDRVVTQVGLFQHRSSAYLHALFTRPDFRQQGAGSFLALAMASEARAAGCERVVLQCARDSRLPAYFERLGFRVVGERRIWTKHD
jgi:N-acetylglutamate synthase-like GNAT family acetyltransferase